MNNEYLTIRKPVRWIFLSSNGIILIYSLHYFRPIPEFILSLTINLLIYIVPGLPLLALSRKIASIGAILLMYIVAVSMFVWLLIIIAVIVLDLPRVSWIYIVLIALVINISFFISYKCSLLRNIFFDGKSLLLQVALFLIAFTALHFGALAFPPDPDQDFEVPISAHGWLYYFKPYSSYNFPRNYFYFHHPPASVWTSALGALFSERINDLGYYSTSAQLAEKAYRLAPGERIRGSLVVPESTAPGSNIIIERINLEKFRVREKNKQGFFAEQYLNEPIEASFVSDFRTETEAVFRIPFEELSEYLFARDRWLFLERDLTFTVRVGNLAISALLSLALFNLVYKKSGNLFLASAAFGLYVFAPGVFVRSLQASHVDVSNFGIFFLACFYISSTDESPGAWVKQPLLLLPGMYAAFADQKAILVIGAIVVHQGLNWLVDNHNIGGLWRAARTTILHSAVCGFTLGMVLYSIYGLLLDRWQFIRYFIYVHGIERLKGGFLDYYPSVPRMLFESVIEAPVILIAVFVLIYLLILFGIRRLIKLQSFFYALLIILAVAVFTWVDWRQSKHLMTVIAPAAAFAYLNSELIRPQHRLVFTIITAITVTTCVIFIVLLFYNPTIYIPHPASW